MKSLLALAIMMPALAFANESEVAITIKDHKFEPAEITVPAGKKIKLLIENKDATPEEFESHALNREKIIAGNGKTTIYIGPLDSGSYNYFGEFNAATAQGVITVK